MYLGGRDEIAPRTIRGRSVVVQGDSQQPQRFVAMLLEASISLGHGAAP